MKNTNQNVNYEMPDEGGELINLLLVGERLRQLRNNHHLKREDMAELLGIKGNAMKNLENGVSRLDIDKLAILHKDFGVCVDELLFGDVNHFSLDGARSYYMGLSREEKKEYLLNLCRTIYELVMMF